METPPPCPNIRVGKVLNFTLALFAGATVYSLVGNWIELSLVNDILAERAVHANDLDAIDSRQRLSKLVNILVWISSGIVFLFFAARTAKVASESGSNAVFYTPKKVVWYYFIPIANLIYPYLAMQEAWRATELSADASSWVYVKRSKIIISWWCLWLGSRLVGYVVPRVVESSGIPLEQRSALYKQLGFNLLDVALTIVTLVMVRAVVLRCQAKWDQHNGPSSAPVAKVEKE